MLKVVLAAALAIGAPTAAAAQARVTPVAVPAGPVAPARPVEETFFGTRLVDPYRYMETPGEPQAAAWMTAQGARTRSVLDSIPARAPYLKAMAAFGGQFGFVADYQEAGGRAFYQERAAGRDAYDLKVRDADGKVRTIIDTGALIAATGQPHAINYSEPSPDGQLVAAGVSVGGSEDASLSVYDAATGQRVAGPVTRAQFGAISWLEDGSGLFMNRLQALPEGAARSERYLNNEAVFWDLKGEPVALAGAKVGKGPAITPIQFVFAGVEAGSPTALLIVQNGVENEVEIHTAPAADAAAGRAAWRKLVGFDDAVTGFALRGPDLYLLSHKDAPTFKLLKVKADAADLSGATEVIPARPDRVITGVNAAADGAYVTAREGLYGVLLRVPAEGGAADSVPLPVKGAIGSVFTDPRRPGAVVDLSSWTTPPTTFRYDPFTRAFTDLKLGVRPAVDWAKYRTTDLKARSHDDAEVPLSVVSPAAAPTPRPLLLEAYGSYGIATLPNFRTRWTPFIDAGGSLAVCHVRGGGELGEAWRLGGKGANKPNTWKDLFSCAETLIARGYTTREQLSIVGGSAGGIPMGRAIVERPELFAGVISAVPMASAIRAEFQTNGPANIPEFGTIKDPQGFKDLLAMDGYYAMEAGKTYPAVMFTGGMNDPRVDVWQPAKAAARLQATGTPNPVLLRIETAGGHGIGSTKSQRDEEEADLAAFVFWRAGVAKWQPGS